jgi:predicted molibdopterin-dependent oxidoreductase YjgC
MILACLKLGNNKIRRTPKMILYIDGRQCEAQPGQTIMEVALQNGINIPHLCYDKHLSIVGACRMCLVEVEGSNKLLASCSTPVVPDMKVTTKSPKLTETRRMIVDLLLSDHPLDCITCEANGKCELQKLAYEYGITKSSFESEKEPRFKIESDNPFIEVDPNKCILCGKCVRVDNEVQASGAINVSYRGFSAKVCTPFDQGLNGEYSTCVFCGQCVEMCPTGALTYKPGKGKGRDYEFEKVITTCPYCGVGCQLELRIKDNEIVQVGSVYEDGNPNPLGETCVKGRFGYDFINHPDRLKNPLIKKNGKFEEATWEEALEYTANKLGEIKDKYGSQSIAGLSSSKCTNEENYLMQKFMRAVIGTNSIDNCARL